MKQSAFLFNSTDLYDANEFIESSSNKLACTAINNWPNDWGVMPYMRVLIIKGPRLSGKTFLSKKWARKSRAVFIDKSWEINESILHEYSSFVVDGFDETWNEEKMLHHFNTIHENGKHLLITTTKIPEIKLSDLRSRIKSSNVININMPDDDLMSMLIFKLFSNYSVLVSQEVIKYLVKIVPREFPEIICAVKRINEFALENQRKITLHLVKESLGKN